MLQALADTRAAEYMKGRKVMEINPDHAIIQALNDNYSEDGQNAAVSLLLLCQISNWDWVRWACKHTAENGHSQCIVKATLVIAL